MARQRPTRLVMGSGIVEIDSIVIREVQYQLEVNLLKGNFGWVWPMWAGHPRIDRIVIRIVQYQVEVNRCRNEEIIAKGNFVWVQWPIWAGCPRVGNWAMHIVQYQLEVNRAAILVVWLVMGPCIVEIDRIVIREVQYQFEVNRCRNEEVYFQGSSAYSVGGDKKCDRQTHRQTDGQTHRAQIITPLR
ncbi:hypothetical protein DPMN_049002 [Dreissena polymorpha]|uniref:Uncharacterized protein n=1 Tax=Dreissena polymorpha TaxID=45954 RepID=A0A9D4DC45_DREPO|nr:hypothetical protein DPMN_049002 [Dreissena polymorpha]